MSATPGDRTDAEAPKDADRPHHVCPWWIGYLLASPLRRLVERAETVVDPHVRAGMTVLDVGCAMGYFTLPIARMVGPDGHVVAVDVQERMLTTLRKRVRRRGLEDRVEIRSSRPESLALDDRAGSIDFALAFHMIHETRDPARFLRECFAALRPGGRLLASEPRGHVSAAAWSKTRGLAEAAGFVVLDETTARKSFTMLLERPAA